MSKAPMFEVPEYAAVLMLPGDVTDPFVVCHPNGWNELQNEVIAEHYASYLASGATEDFPSWLAEYKGYGYIKLADSTFLMERPAAMRNVARTEGMNVVNETIAQTMDKWFRE